VVVTATSNDDEYVFGFENDARVALGWLMINSRKLGTLPPTSVPPEIGGVCASAAGAATALSADTAKIVNSFIASLPGVATGTERSRSIPETDAARS
jgi:hypothetical protein